MTRARGLAGFASAISGPVNSTDVFVGVLTATSLTVSGSASIGGTVTYEDVTNVDSVGVVTAQAGIHVTGGSVGIGTDNPNNPLHVLGADPQIKIQDSENGDNVQIFLDGPNSNLNFDWGSGSQRNINLINSGSGAIRVGVGTDNPTTDLHVFGSTDASTIIDGAAGNGLLTLRNAGNGNYSGINFTRERSTGTNVTGGSIWMPSITANNEATIFIQTQTASAGAGVSSALINNNGVRLKLSSQPNGVSGDSAFTVEVGDAERMRIDSNGHMLIGTTTDNPGDGNTTAGIVLRSNGKYFISCASDGGHVNRNSNGYILNARRSGSFVGGISVTTTNTVFNTSSDYRLKENVVDIIDGITRIKQLTPKRFNFIADADTTVDGFLAHEAQTVVPEAVTGTHNEVDEDDNPVYQGIDQSKLVPLLTAALKEAITKIETLETKVAALEGN